MKPEEAFETNGWDSAFRRFDIAANSGASSPTGVVEVAVLEDVDFDALTQARGDGLLGRHADWLFNTINEGWYFYHSGVHRLVTRAELTYVVKTSAGAYKKVKMLDYYDENGTPASISLKYAPVPAP